MDVRRPFGAVLLAPLLLLTACGGNDSAAGDPTPTFSPTATQSSSAPPKRESPEHFIRRWAEAEKQMENTGDTSEYLAMSKGCKACRKLAHQVAGFYAAGGYVKWGGWRFISIEKVHTTGRSSTFAAVNESAPTKYKESSSGSEKHLNGGRTTELLTITETSSGWIMVHKAEQAS